MTYRELLHLYKKGELEEEQANRIRDEIEKQEAISEYLFDNEHIPEFSDMDTEKESAPFESESDDKNFLKLIKKTIRRAFIKAGVTVAAVVLLLVLLTNTTLPYIVDKMYYNPAEIVGETLGLETNRISLDASVYTELFTPGYYRTKVNVEREGYGEYDVHIPQTTSINGQFRDVYGTVEKGKLTLFSGGLFNAVTGNAFPAEEIDDVILGHVGTGAAGDRDAMLRKIRELDESDYYVGYVTFDRVMTYDELTDWSKKAGITPDWCAVCYRQNESEYIADNIIGFNYISEGRVMGYDKEKYPYLNYCDLIDTVGNFPEDTISAENMETHFLSMLRYIKDNKEFGEMAGLNISEPKLNIYINSVEEHGLDIYGFAVTAQRSTFEELIEIEDVKYIYTEALY